MNTALILILIGLFLAALTLAARAVQVNSALLKQLRAADEIVRRQTEQKQAAQDQRYHLMWDVRRIQEQQIFLLQRFVNDLTGWIRKHGQQPPDDADWWKQGGPQ